MSGLGVYISVPFCRAKCSYCNFASGVFGADRLNQYVDRVCAEIGGIQAKAERLGGVLPERVDSIYLGGGTPSLLTGTQLHRLFSTVSASFSVSSDAEITLECAPGQLSDETLAVFLNCGGNRVSLGIQSFVDREAKAVGRMHSRQSCLEEIARLRASGILNINVDLIAGLPHQTAASWRESVETAIATGAPHISVYMLEVDEDSRLGREMLAAGSRYGAASTPSDEQVADWYGDACGWLGEAGVEQYEISNFARPGFASRHNMKYWRREPYAGFGVDAHSMLRTGGVEAVRWANPDVLDTYLGRGTPDSLPIFAADTPVDRVGTAQAFEESLFLGLRMNEGVDEDALAAEFGPECADKLLDAVRDAEEAGMLERTHGRLRLTHAGRLISNEVFERLLLTVA